MASFCKECSERLFGFDSGDFRFSTAEHEGAERMVLCEGCGGYIVVNEEGLRNKDIHVVDVQTTESVITRPSEPLLRAYTIDYIVDIFNTPSEPIRVWVPFGNAANVLKLKDEEIRWLRERLNQLGQN